MRKLIESTFVSLDGVVESPEKWANPFFEGEAKQYALKKLDDVDTFLLGRASYEKFSAKWPLIRGDEYFDKINRLPKLVVSSSQQQLTWNAQLVSGDVAKELTTLKNKPGKSILKYGTTLLDRTLFEHGLVDELNLWIMPIVLGVGRRLFEGVDPSRINLRPTGIKEFANGVVIHNFALR
ncbi:MAG TPA: dihydrofolate reductase family protein [Opitutaceae bacterium]|nr:dihydrofolate reductase family protein [Opitutaceae bacterium]